MNFFLKEEAVKVHENIPLAPMTTFNIGGPTRFFVEVKSEDELLEATDWAQKRGVPYYIFSGGSNVLVPDEGFDGLSIYLSIYSSIYSDIYLTLGAGNNLWQTIRDASRQGLGGWEKLAGIPGSAGGAVRGNAGAFGPEIKDFVEEVRCIDISDGGKRRVFDNVACEFDYRNSIFKQHPEYIVTEIVVKLSQNNPEIIARTMEETVREREKRHLQDIQAAGSYFMNPVAARNVQELFEQEKGVKSRGGRVPAGWLIEKAGCKGTRVGGAVSSEQHPNYIVNAGGACAQDVLALAEQIKEQVRAKFSIDLEEEVSHMCADG